MIDFCSGIIEQNLKELLPIFTQNVQVPMPLNGAKVAVKHGYFIALVDAHYTQTDTKTDRETDQQNCNDNSQEYYKMTS